MQWRERERSGDRAVVREGGGAQQLVLMNSFHSYGNSCDCQVWRFVLWRFAMDHCIAQRDEKESITYPPTFDKEKLRLL